MKNRLIILISFLVVTILFSACPPNVENTPPEYTITIADIEHGSITSVIDRAVEGAEVVLTVVEEAGYRIKTDSIVVNMADRTFNATRDAEQKTRYFFKMPADDVIIQGEFIPIAELESLSILSGSGTELVKNFDSEITDYTVIAIDAAPVAITVTGTPAYIDDVVEYDINSSISSNLHFGENTVAVTVKSLRGGEKEYIITLIISDIPVMMLDTSNRPIISRDDWLEGASYTLYDGNDVLGDTDVKGRGNGTWNDPKKPYSLKLTNKRSLLGMPEHKRWALLTNYSDKALVHAETGFKIGTIFNNLSWTPRSAQIVFYLNNEYQGVYQLTEAVKIDENRVAIDEIKKNNPGGGYILEIDNLHPEDEQFKITTTKGIVFLCSDPDEDLDKVITGDTRTLLEKMQTDVQQAEDILYSANFRDPDEGYRKYLDVDSFVDWFLASEIMKDYEIRYLNGRYMYYDPVKHKYCMGPLWDLNGTFNHAAWWGDNTTENFIIKDFDGWWVSRLFEDPYFVSAVKARWNSKKQELGSMNTFIEERAAYLNNVQAFDAQKWWNGAVNYRYQINALKSWLSQRLTWLDAAINAL